MLSIQLSKSVHMEFALYESRDVDVLMSEQGKPCTNKQRSGGYCSPGSAAPAQDLVPLLIVISFLPEGVAPHMHHLMGQ